ncbi:MAG: benzoate/H(+) symporter BenE family transporter [Lautropia sp.]|nr:benzoate/H(+) symporter BenE family transporter [Lautropia sp.]
MDPDNGISHSSGSPTVTAAPASAGGFARSWLPPLAAGFIAVLVGFTSSAAIVFQAAAAAGATPAQIGSWIMALGIGMAATCIGLSWFYRMPIVTAWSTPGAALLATSLVGVPLSDAIGAFVFCGLLILIAGATGWFERIINRIPGALAAALLAGVLARFGIDAVAAVGSEPGLVLAMAGTYLAGRRWLPRYAVILVLAVGVGVAALQGLIEPGTMAFTLARPEFVMPTFSLPVLIGVGLPLFVVTMASQNVPGVAVLKACGYDPPVSKIVAWTGAATMLLAPFGAFALNLAAITAAICCGPQALEDPTRRYRASIAAGGFYLVMGLLGASVALLFAALPRELVMAVAGLALLGTIGNGLAAATADERWREPALVTFLVALSGITLFSIGAAFWGVVAGVAAAWVMGVRR